MFALVDLFCWVPVPHSTVLQLVGSLISSTRVPLKRHSWEVEGPLVQCWESDSSSILRALPKTVTCAFYTLRESQITGLVAVDLSENQ
jgi:hypothetical protein